ncbi:MAG: hypothetical protein ACOYVK_02365 [Bacillota bacterium]
MNIPIERQFLHYHGDGSITYTYIIDQSLYIDTIQQGKTIRSLELVNHIIDYAVGIDDQGLLHLVSIAETGELEYWICYHGEWKSKLLTTYDTQTQIFKNLTIYIAFDKIHILVAVSNIIHPELWTLKHHYWSNHTWFNKKVCEIVSGKYETPYHSDIDIYKNIHIVYKSLTKGNHHIFYAKFNATHNMWNIPQNISSSFAENHHPFVFCDQIKGVHILWSGIQNNSYQINYLYNKNNISVKRGWSETIFLSIESTNCTHPYMLQIDNRLAAIWKENDRFRISTSNSMGKTWSDPFFIEIENHETLKSISVLGKTYKNLKPIKIIYALGYLYNDFYLMGVDPAHQREETTSENLCQVSSYSPDTLPTSHEDIAGYNDTYESKMKDIPIEGNSTTIVFEKDNSLDIVETVPTEEPSILINDLRDLEIFGEILDRLEEIQTEQKQLDKILLLLLESHKEHDSNLNHLAKVIQLINENINQRNMPPLGIFRSLFK